MLSSNNDILSVSLASELKRNRTCHILVVNPRDSTTTANIIGHRYIPLKSATQYANVQNRGLILSDTIERTPKANRYRVVIVPILLQSLPTVTIEAYRGHPLSSR